MEPGRNVSRERRPAGALVRRCLHRAGARHAVASRVPVGHLLEAVAFAVAKPPSEKTLEELAQDMHTRADGPAHVAASAEFELRRPRAQVKATTRMLLVSIARGVRAASAAIDAGRAAVRGFCGIRGAGGVVGPVVAHH